jgi:hypothetical protein
MFKQTFDFNGLYHGSGCQWQVSHHGVSVQISDQPMRDLWLKKMALGSVFLRVLRFYPVTTTPPMLLLILTYTLLLPERQRANPGCLLNSNACSENRLALYRRNFRACISKILLISPDNDLYFILYFDGYYVFK